MAKIAQAAGFEWVRCRGSHNTFRSVEGVVVVIPDRANQVITRPLTRKLIRDMGLTLEEYNRIADTIV
jgi:predicted RNA binding protein YcfA (HicA-like mRNA interferase family)